MLELAELESDQELLSDISGQLKELDKEIERKEKEFQFDGPHDKGGAIMTIMAGAGGTDAQDWAQMLERMYLRWSERAGWKTRIIDRAKGDEAGIKRSMFEVSGQLGYGRLKGEHGVHRLVRLSPFNADNLRQTSFAKVEVLPKLSEQEAPVIDNKDLEIDTYRASGAGGQHVNKTDSAVRIRHVPTGIVVQCQNERSQAQNKAQAMAVLTAKLQVLSEAQQASEIKELRGENQEAAWGNQIRSYVMHPYQMVKDHRSKVEDSDVAGVLDGDLSAFIPKSP